MKYHRPIFSLLLFLLFVDAAAVATRPDAGFFLPDSVNEMTLQYRTVNGLIVLPVTINDSIQVNLILDTGCRNLILFGKKFKNLFGMRLSKPIEFSGLGTGPSVKGTLSIGNKVSINAVLGNQIPVVIVESSNVFGNYQKVHGVIGYDIFLKFEIELNAGARTVTFRPAVKTTHRYGYTQIPLRVIDARPVMHSTIFLDKKTSHIMDLMIDTGSSLGLLLKTTSISDYGQRRNEKVLGIGFNGPVSGYETVSNKLVLEGMQIEDVRTGIVSSPWHNNASIGMEVLKDYIVVLNYCKSYASFKRNDA
jgi:hypothetical protein